MTVNRAVAGKHAGIHQDQFRSSKQARADAAAEIQEAIQELQTEPGAGAWYWYCSTDSEADKIRAWGERARVSQSDLHPDFRTAG